MKVASHKKIVACRGCNGSVHVQAMTRSYCSEPITNKIRTEVGVGMLCCQSAGRSPAICRVKRM